MVRKVQGIFGPYGGLVMRHMMYSGMIKGLWITNDLAVYENGRRDPVIRGVDREQWFDFCDKDNKPMIEQVKKILLLVETRACHTLFMFVVKARPEEENLNPILFSFVERAELNFKFDHESPCFLDISPKTFDKGYPWALTRMIINACRQVAPLIDSSEYVARFGIQPEITDRQNISTPLSKPLGKTSLEKLLEKLAARKE